MATAAPAIERDEWIDSPLGHYLIEREQAYFDKTVADIFGYNAFQLGMPELDLLRASRIPLRCRVGPERLGPPASGFPRLADRDRQR